MPSSASNLVGQPSTTNALSGWQKDLHDFLGGGKAADVVLWRNKLLSAGILTGFTVIWLLFDVMEYHFLTLLSYVAITTMLVAFIWSNSALLFGLSRPKIPEVRILSEQAFKEFVETFHPKLRRYVSILHGIAFGENLKLLLVAIFSLWTLSVMGSWCSPLSLLYFVFLCIQTLPALYKRYEHALNKLYANLEREVTVKTKKLEQEVLKNISRGQVKQKKVE